MTDLDTLTFDDPDTDADESVNGDLIPDGDDD